VYPEDCIQALVDPWWTKTADSEIRRGRLLRAFVPQAEMIPLELVPEGRGDNPADHSRAKFRIQQLRISQPSSAPSLPVAALPHYPGETNLVQRSKQRWVLVISPGGPELPKPLRSGGAKYQYAPFMSVAPYYGAESDGKRAGWKPEFVKRAKACEYPHFIWEKLPIPTRTGVSILRLDHIQPIGRHADSFRATEFCLSNDALGILDDWQLWLQTGMLPEDSVLFMCRQELQRMGMPD
jgi:hypothetical protein